MKKTVILSLLLTTITGHVYAYSDMTDSPFAPETDKLSTYGIVNGYEDGSFRPENKITRAETAKMLAAAMGYGQHNMSYIDDRLDNFSDFTENHWAYEYVVWLNNTVENLFEGFGDGSFRPDDNITVAQISKMAIQAHGNGGYINYVDNSLGYPYSYINTGVEYGFLNGIDISDSDREITRAEAAKIISNTIEIPMTDELGYSDIDDNNEIFWHTIRVTFDGNNRFPFMSFETCLQSGNWISDGKYITANPLKEDNICTVLGDVISLSNDTVTVMTKKIHAHDGGLYLPEDMLEVSFKMNGHTVEVGDNYCFVLVKDNGEWQTERCCVIK